MSQRCWTATRCERAILAALRARLEAAGVTADVVRAWLHDRDARRQVGNVVVGRELRYGFRIFDPEDEPL